MSQLKASRDTTPSCPAISRATGSVSSGCPGAADDGDHTDEHHPPRHDLQTTWPCRLLLESTRLHFPCHLSFRRRETRSSQGVDRAARLPDGHADLTHTTRQVEVAGHSTAFVVDDDGVARVAEEGRRHHGPGGGGQKQGCRAWRR